MSDTILSAKVWVTFRRYITRADLDAFAADYPPNHQSSTEPRP